MDSAQELRQKAEHYRELATLATDPRAIEAALELASEFEALAVEVEATRSA